MTGRSAGPRWEGRLLTDAPHRGPDVSDPVTYTAVLPVAEETVLFGRDCWPPSDAAAAPEVGGGRWAARQAVLILRWFCDGTRLAQLAADSEIGRSTAYRYLHEGIDVLAAVAPGLRGALLAAKLAGHTHLQLDGTLIRTDRSTAAGPATTAHGRVVDLWWSGKHHHHGGKDRKSTSL